MNLNREQLLIGAGAVVVVLFIANTLFKGSKVSHFLNNVIGILVPVAIGIGVLIYFTRGVSPGDFSTAKSDIAATCEQEVLRAIRGTDGLESVHVDKLLATVHFNRPVTQEIQKAVGTKAASVMGEILLKDGQRSDFSVVVLVRKERAYRVVYNPANGLVSEEHF